MVADKHIVITQEVKTYLDKSKITYQESYDSVLRRLLKFKEKK